jgi:hypothetical protein
MGGIECFDAVPCPCLCATVVLPRGVSFDVLFFLIHDFDLQSRGTTTSYAVNDC